jgi:hypothetical protein
VGKNLWLLAGYTLVTLAASSGRPQPDEPDKKPPFTGPPPPEELRVLEGRVGQWTSQWEFRKSLQHKEGFKATGAATGQWLHNRHFIRMEGTTIGAKYREESSVLYGYDARKKCYRRWLFTSGGLGSEAEGNWDEGKKTMTWRPLNLPPGTTGSITEVSDKDRVETTVLLKRDDGQVVLDLTIVGTRKKEADK